MPAGAEHLLALDLGTSRVRALVVRADGAVRGRAARRLRLEHPAPGRVEQDPRELLRSSLEVLQEALARAGLGARDCAGLGIATQRSSALAWDARRLEPLAPAMGWQDQRVAEDLVRWRERGARVSGLASAPRFAWWLAHEPAVREAARAGRLRLGTPDAWLAAALSGESITDASQACCTGLYDDADGGWSAARLAIFGLEEAWLPRIVPTAGPHAATRASLLGVEVPLAARAGDQQAASFAAGLAAPGAAKLTLGTAAMLDVHTGPRAAQVPRGAFPLVLWELPGNGRAWCLEGSVLAAGAAVEWLVGAGLLESPAALDATAAQAASGHGVVCVPALQGLGTPYLREQARGLFGGLTRGSGRAELVRAVLEGIAQRCADVAQTLPLAEGPLRVDGGLARSDLLLQLLADLLGREVWRAAETETTALGAALLAGLGSGALSRPEDVLQRLAPPVIFRPRLDAEAREGRRAAWRDAVARAL
jgi:glycerol kinase